jgi:hypothetical protein
MWLFSGEPEHPEDETVKEMHGANALYSAVTSLMLAIRTGNQDAQQDAAHRMIQIAKHWMKRRWSEGKLANRNPWFGYRWIMHTLVLSNGLNKSKLNS